MDKNKPGICRVCLAKSKTMYVSIYEKYKDSCLSDYIRTIADVQICVNDGLPDRICSSCLVELEQAVQFKQKCESSHHILTTTHPVIKTEDEFDIKDIVVKEEEFETQFSETDCEDQYEVCENNEDLIVNNKSEVKKSKAIDLHLQCDDCKELFKSKCKLQVHWKKVHFLEALKCPDCKRMFKSSKAFNSHRKQRPQSCKYASKFRIEGDGKKRVFHCKECTYNSRKITSLLYHEAVHTKEQPFECDICFKTFKLQTKLQSHHYTVHSVEDQKKEEEPTAQFSEPDCDDQYDVCEDNEDLKVSDKSEVKKSKAIDLHLQCDDCKELFKSKCKLRVHWKKVHLYETLKCPECKRMFKSYKAFNSHKIKRPQSCKFASKLGIVGEGRKRVFHCKECTYSSKRIKDIISHIVIHTGERPFKCKICLRTYTQQAALQLHQEYRHPELLEKEERPCHFCGKLIGRIRMSLHLSRAHSKIEWPCLICSKKLKSKHSLGNHMKIHMGVKSYTCETCGKDFFTSTSLANHKYVMHEKKIKLYKCDFCDYSSKSEITITKHRVKHNDNNISCTVCGIFFESKQKFVRHQRRHFEKMFECNYCDKKFSRKDNIQEHIKRRHKDKVPVHNDESKHEVLSLNIKQLSVHNDEVLKKKTKKFIVSDSEDSL